jgi:hypothetical protein
MNQDERREIEPRLFEKCREEPHAGDTSTPQHGLFRIAAPNSSGFMV